MRHRLTCLALAAFAAAVVLGALGAEAIACRDSGC